MTFRRTTLVRFGHCDPAALVFYPRYFEIVNEFVEDWFAEGLKASFSSLLYRHGIITPTVHFTVDFRSASRFGDRITLSLAVTKVGRSSCHVDIEASHKGEIRMSVTQIIVFVDRAKRAPIPIPARIARRMRSYMSPRRHVTASA